jgi:hypothetical protein
MEKEDQAGEAVATPTVKVEIVWVDDLPNTVVQAVLRISEDESDTRVGTGYCMVDALESLVRSIKQCAVDADEKRMRKILGVG